MKKKEVFHSAEQQEPLGQMFCRSPGAIRQTAAGWLLNFCTYSGHQLMPEQNVLGLIVLSVVPPVHGQVSRITTQSATGAKTQRSGVTISTVIVRLVVSDTNLSPKNNPTRFSLSFSSQDEV